MKEKEFYLHEIAKLSYGNKYDKNKMTHINPTINFVSRTALNNGISDYVDEITTTKPFKAGTITLAFGGSVGSVFLQEQPYYTGQNVGVIELPSEVSRGAKLYFITTLEKVCKQRFVAFSDEINKHFKKDILLSLPVKENDTPDWDYMENYIAELEKERVAELEAYLVATGLNDYELTEEDRRVLSLSGFRNNEESNSEDANRVHKEMREFRCGDLFSFSAIKQAKSQSQIPSDDNGVAYIVQSMRNNMCSRYVSRKWLIEHNEPPVHGNCIVLGVTLPAVSYQPDEFGASQVITARADFLNEEVGIYFATLLEKQSKQFSYSSKPSFAAYKAMTLVLPIKTDIANNPIINQERKYHPEGYIPDWDFMEKYIRAIEKIVIADVVKWKDEMIEKTKTII